MSDYHHIAAAIRYLDEHRATRPDPAALAAGIGLSQARLHELARVWADTSAENLLPGLMFADAKKSSARGAAALADPAGRHTPRVNLQPATAAELKARGTGWTILAGVAGSPFGPCLIGATARGICQLAFFDENGRDAARAGIAAGWPLAKIVWDDAHAAGLAARIFTPSQQDLRSPPCNVLVRGTPFQLQVWQALLRIPAGSLVSYGKLAAAVGNPAASRATGSAVGANPVAFLIPCHRVVRATGVAGHYRWGAVRKRAILAWERARVTEKMGRS